MHKFYPIQTLVIILILSFCGVAPCAAEVVKVGIGFSLSPYVIESQDGGLEVDIIREAFKVAGFEAVFSYLPNLRLPVGFSQGSVDCIASNAAYDLAKDSGRPAYPSVTTITYQNNAVTLSERGYVIDSIDDLSSLKVLGFNNSAKYLGPEYQAMAESNAHYSELADQSLQVRMLYIGRVDVVIAGKRIFQYWHRKLLRTNSVVNLQLNRPLEFHPIFPASPRAVLFADEKLRDTFNAGLQKIKANGVYDAILERYLGENHAE